ncbi:hypothetical protein Vretimale_13493 [Volvox reticuliferus]|uniref:Tudor domain-containing protein n=1 Tax=Volvox reticuliferus TaxID=1737510 RepID=A0A8J4GLE1_9CHLO|nr:hypothetical protein Vretifemale_339 [Volvox reticuliferus]GIM09651.1 hypothetical protein Vretimale_13493 [Volvox reticuliferus]
MGPVDEQKRELCKQAYLLICKYCAAAGKEGKEACDFRNTLRKPHALDIDKETNKLLVAELTKFKQQGGIAALLTPTGTAQPAYGGSAGAGAGAGSAGVKATRSKGAGGSAAGTASGLPPLGPGTGAAGAATRSAAKPSRSAAKGGSKVEAPGQMPASLPPRIGYKVNRWWPKEGQWFTAVVTDYNSETNEYRLTYNLCNQNETYEDFNLDMADPTVFNVVNERINLLSKTNSAAVKNSTVLKPFLPRGGSGGGGGSSKSKKRRSESSDEDSDY